MFYTAIYSNIGIYYYKQRVLFKNVMSPDGTLYRDHVLVQKNQFAFRSLQERRGKKLPRYKLPTCKKGTKVVFMAIPYEYKHLGETKKGLRQIRNLMRFSEFKG